MNQIFALKTNRAFYQAVLAVVVALAALMFAALEAYQLSSLYFAVWVHKIKDACGCENMAQFFSMHSDVFRAVILFAAGIGIFIIYSLYKLARLHLNTKRYIASYLSFSAVGHSEKLKMAIEELEVDKTRVVEINKSDLTVFCFGYLKPKICISRALVTLLNKDELKVVLAHEYQHAASYEPLRIFFVKYFKSIFFFLPGLKTSANKYFTFSELAADEQASGDVHAKSSLASAILKISNRQEDFCLDKKKSLIYFDSIIEERASRLNDESYMPKFKILDRSLIIGSLGLAIVSILFIFVFSTSTKAFEMHNIANCVSPVSIGQKSSEICAAEIRKDIPEKDNSIIRNISSDNFGQNFACKAD